METEGRKSRRAGAGNPALLLFCSNDLPFIIYLSNWPQQPAAASRSNFRMMTYAARQHALIAVRTRLDPLFVRAGAVVRARFVRVRTHPRTARRTSAKSNLKKKNSRRQKEMPLQARLLLYFFIISICTLHCNIHQPILNIYLDFLRHFLVGAGCH